MHSTHLTVTIKEINYVNVITKVTVFVSLCIKLTQHIVSGDYIMRNTEDNFIKFAENIPHSL